MSTAGRVGRAGGGIASAAGRRARESFDLLPEAAKAELQTSVRKLAAVRTPKDLLKVLEAEVARLSHVVVPVLAQHPLPVHNRRSASRLAGLGAGLAAAFAEVDELAIVVTDGLAAPTAVASGAGLLAALVLELWVAVSLRIHQVEAAGREVDEDLLADEVTAAILGTDVVLVRQLAGRASGAIGRRFAKRWAGALVPGAGIAIEGWAASRTVRSIAALPLDAHPLRATAAHRP